MKQEGNMVGLQATKGAPHTIPSPKHFTTGLFNQAGSFTEVWQKQADKLNWSKTLNSVHSIVHRGKVHGNATEMEVNVYNLIQAMRQCQKYKVETNWCRRIFLSLYKETKKTRPSKMEVYHR